MHSFIFSIVGPVFLLVLAGFASVKHRLLSNNAIDGVMGFATHIAVPCLLFRATSSIDLAVAFDWRPLLAYYGTAVICFSISFVIAQSWFHRRPGEAVAVSFTTLYSNLLLIGIPIIERAFGHEALQVAFALVSLNAPLCYLVGISVMENVRIDGRSLSSTVVVVLKAMLRNALMIGILGGIAINLSGFKLPIFLADTVDMVKATALPCALFALGGVLTRYSLSQSMGEAGLLSAVSLLLKPLIAYVMCTLLGIDGLNRNVVVLMAAMPAGLNALLFANLYSRGVGTAANTVLLATVMSIISISTWLWLMMQ